MAKKKRIPIPSELAADVLFWADMTCCVCNIRGRSVQIHHIDENPANNDISNLSVLCMECHEQTMIKGGFGRRLGALQIIKYRNDWNERVKSRKAKADEIASIQMVTGSEETAIDEEFEDYLNYKTHDDPSLLTDYLQKIIIVHQAQLTIARTKWDTGVTAIMNQGSSDMVDFYEEVLIELCTFYPKGHFNNLPPKKYLSEIISNKFLWHQRLLEPEGIGTGGTMASTLTGGKVMDDLKHMVVDMVSSLYDPYELEGRIGLKEWEGKWLKE